MGAFLTEPHVHKKAVFMFLAEKRGPWATLLTQAAILNFNNLKAILNIYLFLKFSQF